jgi:formate dehydrogenase subunit gamma
MRTLLVVGLAVTTLVACAPGSAWAQEADRVLAVCQDCHRGTSDDRVRALSHADSISCRSCHHVGLTNDPVVARANRLEACASCHEGLESRHDAAIGEGAPECTACHSIHSDPPLPAAAASIDDRCAACHGEPHQSHAPDAENPPGCVDCHAEHGMGGAAPASPTETCSGCHQNAHPMHASVPELEDCSVCHRVALPLGEAPTGVPEAACLRCHAETPAAHVAVTPHVTCVECHDFSAGAVGERLAPSAAPAAPGLLCGSCHGEELAAVIGGGHGNSAASLHGDTPTCASCHAIHEPVGVQTDGRRRAIQETVRCIECHESEAVVGPYALTPSVGASYADDFHGATVRFLAAGGSDVADEDVLLCSDCHGAHDVEVLARDQIAGVCARCHADAGEALASAWLGHRPVGPRNGTLVWLVRVFYLFLIPFMLGGLFLNIAFHLVDQRRKGARIRDSEGLRRVLDRIRGKAVPVVETVLRFTRVERLEHAGAMTTFILLVLTGLPQTRPDLPLARGIIGLFGGIWSTRLIHRIVGFTFVALMLMHVVRAVSASLRRHKLPAMVPTRKDFEDVLQTFRHYLFRAPLPRVAKFDFSQKFEYWGLFLGGLVMSGTGVALVFPELVTQVLPGVVVAALRVMHGLEATFAVLVIVLWHSYGVILRPEIFPLDTTIFTGRMDVRRLKHEHELEYERLYPGAGEP